jgi:hypothetical protein
VAQLVIPADFAFNLADALRFWSDTDAAVEFRALVAADTPWSPARPRQLLAWAERRLVAVDGARLLAVVLTGFHDSDRQRRLRAATRELRQAAERVADGREAQAMVGEGVHVWAEQPRFNPDDWWGPNIGSTEVRHATAADIAELRRLTAAQSAPVATPVSAPASPRPSRPGMPGGRPLPFSTPAGRRSASPW